MHPAVSTVSSSPYGGQLIGCRHMKWSPIQVGTSIRVRAVSNPRDDKQLTSKGWWLSDNVA
jgi:hypothetical protein